VIEAVCIYPQLGVAAVSQIRITNNVEDLGVA
jgi:hypothetical protein